MSIQNIWHPASWQTKTQTQQPIYPSRQELNEVVNELTSLPPLVTTKEVEALKTQLHEAAIGKKFLLQGGDCAESFTECTKNNVTNKLKILLQMGLVLSHGLHKPIIRVGRIAGQYAKPRSTETETQNNVSLPSYRGDIINRLAFTQKDRTPCPQLLLQGYHSSAITLNYIREFIDNGFANLLHPEYWQLDFVKHSVLADEYQNIVTSIRDTFDISDLQNSANQRFDFYTSHEALLLFYEQALTRKSENKNWYNLSTHFPWMGMRTASLDGAHMEYFRGISNPIAVKIGPSMTKEWISELTHILNPHNEPGRLTFIHRLGAIKIAALLPPLIEAVQATQKTVLWVSDPMHGNTEITQDGIKTRRFEDILSELQQAFIIHQKMSSHLGGVHFELTGENVTECTGGARELSHKDLKNTYTSLCDPRLNYEQALEMAMFVVQSMKKNTKIFLHG